MLKLPPLSLYIHIPWCVQKCPYCDFNSHALKGDVPHQDGVRARLPVASDAEITMEANPGAVEADRFSGYQRAGINRISIGVQSFSAQKLTRLGRIHGPDEARRAAELATSLQLRSFNLDLMHGLPDQTLEEALDDY